MSLILLWSRWKVKSCRALRGTCRVLISGLVASPQTVNPWSELCRVKLLRPSQRALRSIFLLFLIYRHLTHLELCRGIDLRGKLLILGIARLRRVRRANLDWSPWSPEALAKNVAWLERRLILGGVSIECAFFGDHRLLMLSWEIVGVINTWSVSHCRGRPVRLRLCVSQLPWKMLLVSWLLKRRLNSWWIFPWGIDYSLLVLYRGRLLP